MAKNTVTVTTSWQKVASGACVITIMQNANGRIFFNESGSDTNASEFYPGVFEQFEQTETVDTYVKASVSGYKILIDGVL